MVQNYFLGWDVLENRKVLNVLFCRINEIARASVHEGNNLLTYSLQACIGHVETNPRTLIVSN